jgi:PAS domain S-box-containing protein
MDFNSVRHHNREMRKFFNISRPAMKELLFTFLPLLLALFLSGATIFILAPFLRDSIIEERKVLLRELTNTTAQLLEHYHLRVKSGELTLAEAQSRAAADLRNLRHGKDGEGYFWIQGITPPTLVMHPHRPDLVGTDLFQLPEQSWVDVFSRAQELVREEGGGFIEYGWTSAPAEDKPYSKISYVQEFVTWNWIIGTGVFLEDIEIRVDQLSRKILTAFLSLILALSLLISLILLRNRRIERQRRAMVKSLYSVQAELEEIFHNTFQYIAKLDREGRVLKVNQTALASIGHTDDFLILHRYFWETPWWAHSREVQDQIKEGIAFASEGRLQRFELTQRNKEGRVFDTDITIKPVYSAEGDFLFLMAEGRDITDQKAHERYRINLNRIQKIIIRAKTPEAMVREVCQVLMEVLKGDQAWAVQTIGSGEEQFELSICHAAPSWIIPEEVLIPQDESTTRTLRELISSGEPGEFYTGRAPALPPLLINFFHAQSVLAAPCVPRMGFPWILGISQCSYRRIWTDMDRMLLQEVVQRMADGLNTLLFSRTLEETKNYMTSIIDFMPSMLVGLGKTGQVIYWNREMELFTGRSASAMDGLPLVQALPQFYLAHELVNRTLQRSEKVFHPRAVYQNQGSQNYLDITVYPILSNGRLGAVMIMDNVTERVYLEEMMVQSEKMLSVGGLAAGMAHEINNPLAGMTQTAEVMSQRLHDQNLGANVKAAEELNLSMEKITAYMEKRGIFSMIESIKESGQRAAGIVQNMLSFSRKSDTAVSSHDMAELINHVIDLAATDYNLKKQYDFRAILIEKEYEPDLPLVPCEGAKIQQVILNILRNGAEAMNDHGNQRKNLGLPTPEPRFILRLSTEPDFLRIEIEDNGPGMNEDTRKRCFEPFYTTKGVGVGTGLGLSVSYFIITENHGGTMEVRSVPGEGSLFIIRLPLVRSFDSGGRDE